MDANITHLSHLSTRSIAGWLVATSLLCGACHEEGTHQEPALQGPTLRSAAAGSPTVVGMGLGDGRSWVLTDDGKIKGWGEPYCDSTGCSVPAEIEPISLDAAALEVHGNDELAIARLVDGSVLAWTPDALGVSAPVPMTFSGSEPVAQLALGAGFACARLDGGEVRCLGIGSPQAPASVIDPKLAGPVIDLAAGVTHACAVLDTGAVQCWGSNTSEQLGSPSATGTVTIALAGSAERIVAGGEHTCALLETGAVQCWGSNAQGQLGHASTGVGTVPLSERATTLAAGAQHTCAITTTDGSLYCWGNDDLGQLGEGEDLGSLRRTDLDEHHATAVFAGPTAWTTFAVLDHGGLRGWGSNDVGQLGYGDLFGGGGTTWAVGKLPDIIIYDGNDAE